MKNFFKGRHPAWGLRRLASLKDNLHAILHGSNQEKERVKGQFFYMADTPDFMKKLGLIGEYFSVRYGVIARHQGKDADHRLGGAKSGEEPCSRLRGSSPGSTSA